MCGKLVVLMVALMVVSCYSVPYKHDNYKKSCPCFKIYLPVCGSDGKTYDNMCEFKCQADHLLLTQNIKLLVAKEDRCDAQDFDYSDNY